MSVSLVVVSRDRYPFLLRLLDYYVEQEYESPILVGDASSPTQQSRVVSLKSRYGGKLDLRLTVYPEGTSVQDRMHAELAKVSTPCMAWVGDDDFLVPASLKLAAAKLREDPGCSAVVGKALLFLVEKDAARGKILAFGDYAQRAYEDPSPWSRFLAYVQNPCALTFAVRRTEFARDLWDSIRRQNWPSEVYFHAFYETVDAAMSAIAGKVWRCPSLTLIRQVRMPEAKPRVAEWRSMHAIAGEREFGAFVEAVADTLVQELRRTGHEESVDSLAHRVRDALWVRVSSAVQKEAKIGLGLSADAGGNARSSVRNLLRLGVLAGIRRSASVTKTRLLLGAHDGRQLARVRRITEAAEVG